MTLTLEYSGETYAAISQMINALERIATALENRPQSVGDSETKREKRPRFEAVNDALAQRVIDGESPTQISRTLGVTSPSVRARVLRAFARRNPAKYESLIEEHDNGCVKEPSMRLLVEYAREFGFKALF